MRLLLLTFGFLVLSLTQAFYLPGVAPKDYKYGEPVQLKVNALTSTKTDLGYDYYKLPFCQPDTVKRSAENLGELLTGNKIENSPYEIEFKVDKECVVLCRKVYNFFQVNEFVQKIKEGYLVNWIVDNLPAAFRVPEGDGMVYEWFQGFPVGGILVDDETDGILMHYLNNHARITIKYHERDDSLLQKSNSGFEWDGSDDFDMSKVGRIVGFDVEPISVKHGYDGNWDVLKPPQLSTCENGVQRRNEQEYMQGLDGWSDDLLKKGNKANIKKRFKEKIKSQTEVIWTYDVRWEESDTTWATRWDIYLNADGKQSNQVHWFSVINSLIIVLFLTSMVAMIMMRTLSRDLSRYNRVPTDEERAEDREETGWKLVHGDVFRPPAYPLLFSVTVGTGAQVATMAMFVVFFSSIGFISPAYRGSLAMAVLLMFALLGSVAGYCSARAFKSFGGKEWQRCTILTATLYPGIVFAAIFTMNLIVWIEGSSNAIPFFSLIAVLFLWFGISVPLTFLGAFYGFKKDVDDKPVKTNDIPRQIPAQPWYMTSSSTILLGGVLPFGAAFVEIYFIMTSIWMDRYYFVFGFLFLVYLIVVITCAEITIVLTYFQLCSEDYEWQWRSLLTSGSSALYLFLYSLILFSSQFQIDLVVSAFLYLGYMSIISLIFFLMTSVIGYYACDWFVTKIYAAVKVD